jgi:hypothetical protein
MSEVYLNEGEIGYLSSEVNKKRANFQLKIHPFLKKINLKCVLYFRLYR